MVLASFWLGCTSGMLQNVCIEPCIDELDRKDTGLGFHDFIQSSQSFIRESSDPMEVTYFKHDERYRAKIKIKSFRRSDVYKFSLKLSNQVQQNRFNQNLKISCQYRVLSTNR